MSRNKELQLEILLAILLLIGISLMPVAVGVNWEEIAKNSTLKIAILGDSTEIKESLVKSANASNIYTSADLNSDIFEQVNIIFINSSYLKNLQGTEGKEAVALRLDSLAHSGKTMIAIGSNPEILYEYVKPNSMVIDLNSGQQEVVALGVMIFPDNTSSSRFTLGNISQVAGEMFIWAVETIQMREEVDASANKSPPMSVGPPLSGFREVVVVYFREMPASLDEFASRYGGKLIFAKLDIKLAAFETNPIARSAQTSQQTLDFINRISKDSSVEKAYRDEFEFIRSDEEYSPEPRVIYPEDMKDEYVPNKVIVGFWRRPPSLEDFASKHGGKLTYYEEVLMFAAFDVSNISEFIGKVSTDPYVRYAHPDSIGSILGSGSGDLGSISGEAKASKAPGFGLLGGLIAVFCGWLFRGG